MSWKRAARLALTITVVGYVAYLAIDLIRDGEQSFARVGAGNVLVILVLNILWLCLFATAWSTVLNVVLPESQHHSRAEVWKTFFKSLLARYIPGKVAFLAVRIDGLSRLGISPARTVAAIVLEQFCFIAATCLVGLLSVPLFIANLFESGPANRFMWIGLALSSISFVWFLAPARVLSFMILILPRTSKFGIDGHMIELKSVPTRAWHVLNGLFVTLVVAQALLVIPVATPFIQARPDGAWGVWAVALLAYPLARLVGQLGLAVPAGIGVREGAYVLLTASVLQDADALAIAGYLRLASLTAEGIMYFVSEGAARFQPHPGH